MVRVLRRFLGVMFAFVIVAAFISSGAVGTTHVTTSRYESLSIYGNADLADLRTSGVCTGSGTISDPYVITDLIIGGSSGAAISIMNVDTNLTIRNCIITDSFDGISIIGSTNITISNNTIENVYDGLYLYDVVNITITNNTIIDSMEGIYLAAAGGSTIFGNTIIDSMEGIYLADADGNIVLDNDILRSNWCGICLAFSDDNTISGNSVTDAKDFGIYLRESDGNTISDNAMHSVVLGIDIEEMANNTVTGNTISYMDETSGDGGELVVGAAAVVIIVLFCIVFLSSRNKGHK
jgi:parallel beta-helix repeat protein